MISGSPPRQTGDADETAPSAQKNEGRVIKVGKPAHEGEAVQKVANASIVS